MEGGVVEIGSSAEFRRYTSQKKLVVVDFFAKWCGPCRMISPQVEALTVEYPNVDFIKVDVDALSDVAQECGVRSMPTFQFYIEGAKACQLAVVSVSNRTQRDEFSGADVQRLRSVIAKLSAEAPSAPQPFSGTGFTLGSAPSTSAVPETAAGRADDNDIGEQLKMLGFAEALIKSCLAAGHGKTLEDAIDWIMENQDQQDNVEPVGDELPVPAREETAADVPAPMSLEEKDRLLKEKIADLHRQRKEESKKKEHEEEIQRRQMGRDVQRSKEARMEYQRNRAAEDRKKERDAAKAEKARILESINAAKRERHAENVARLQTAAVAVQQNPPENPAFRSGGMTLAAEKSPESPAVIKVRLLDGRTVQQELIGRDTLGDLLRQLNLPGAAQGVYSFVLSFPRRTFTPFELEEVSLLEAGLVPNGTLMLQRFQS